MKKIWIFFGTISSILLFTFLYFGLQHEPKEKPSSIDPLQTIDVMGTLDERIEKSSISNTGNALSFDDSTDINLNQTKSSASKETQHKNEGVDQNAPEAFKSADYKEFLSATDLSDSLEQLMHPKDAQSIDNEIYLDTIFRRWQQDNRDFNQLVMDTSQCNIEVCVISISGAERLNSEQIEQFENEMLFDKTNGFSKVAAKQSGGTYAISEQNNLKFIRIVIATHTKFSGNGIR